MSRLLACLLAPYPYRFESNVHIILLNYPNHPSQSIHYVTLTRPLFGLINYKNVSYVLVFVGSIHPTPLAFTKNDPILFTLPLSFFRPQLCLLLDN